MTVLIIMITLFIPYIDGYKTNDLILTWMKRPLDVDIDIALPEFTLQDAIISDCTSNYTVGT